MKLNEALLIFTLLLLTGCSHQLVGYAPFSCPSTDPDTCLVLEGQYDAEVAAQRRVHQERARQCSRGDGC